MFVKTVVDVLIVAALIVAMYHEDKIIRFERDCRAIRRACKRQGITARDKNATDEHCATYKQRKKEALPW